MFFNIIFSRFFVVLTSEHEAKIDYFSNAFRKRRFCKNRAPVEAGARFLRFGTCKNRPKIDAKTLSKKALQKHLAKIDFGLRFGLPKPPEIPPKSFKIPLESDVERSLFRDALGLAKKSSQGNGNRRL